MRKKAPRVNKLLLRKRRGKRGGGSNSQRLFTSGDQEEDFGEHSLSYTLTLNEVEAKYFSGRARD